MTRSVSFAGYSARIAPGLLDEAGFIVRQEAPAHRYAIVTDDNVAPLYAPRVCAAIGAGLCSILPVPAGEAYKTRESWARLTDELIEHGLGRDTTVVALGGGVIGDLAGFVAATFMRGVPYVQIPTTILAMIDAAIGGKTGVDTPAGKNLVGAFHRPAAVIIDPLTLSTLPERHFRAGLAEAFKHGIIADAAYFDYVAQCANTGFKKADDIVEVIARSVEIKGEVVRLDEHDRGPRKTLNFGHTLGHAIEAQSGYRILHGEAIAIGMSLESEIAERARVAEPGTAATIRSALAGAGLPHELPRELDSGALLAATRSDKKSRRGVAEYALPRRIGEMAGAESGWTIQVADALVLEVLG